MNTIILSGLRADSISGYFSALGVLRLVSEQKDPAVCGRFGQNGFELETELTQEELVRFFQTEYVPTPIFSPWNMGSGFFGTGKDAIKQIQKHVNPRFDEAKRVISKIQKTIQDVGFCKATKDELKFELCQNLRASSEDRYLEWLDAVFVARSEKDSLFSSFMWSGGNDANAEFSRLFWERFLSVVDQTVGVESILFDQILPIMSPPAEKCAGSFFLPATGGYNRDSGFNADSSVNPWEYVLTVEGMVLMQSSLSKRSEAKRVSVSPFVVNGMACGFASAVDEEKSQGEFWAPVWGEFCTFGEVRKLFSEGRVQSKRNEADDSFSFSQSLSGLGVDRRIAHFNRWGIFVRKGDMHVTSFQGRWDTHRKKQCDPLSDLVAWSKASQWMTTDKSPAAQRTAKRLLEKSLFSSIQSLLPRDVLQTLACVFRLRLKLKHPPKLTLPSEVWEPLVREDSAEYRLAASFASLTVPRIALWRESLGLHGNLAEILYRWELDGVDGFPTRFCSAQDVQEFLDGDLDEKLLESYILGLSVLKWSRPTELEPLEKNCYGVSRVYLALKIAKEIERARKLPLSKLLVSGKQDQALALAKRRLAANRIQISQTPDAKLDKNRLASALVFSPNLTQLRYLAHV